MLKTISAALLAVSVLAAPALAAESGKTTANTSIIKTTTQVKPAVLNANAKMGKHHHHRTHLSHHYRHHGKIAAMKTIQPKAHAKTAFKTTLKTAPKVSLKPAVSTTRRG
jgi:hypothetical protein